MSFISLLGVEFKKIRRSKILWILLTASVILWLPSTLNAGINFQMQAEGISPEHNFLIQGLLGMSWFMFPASVVVATVLINQTERTNKGILKMLALPVNTTKLCFAKFTVLLVLSAVQIFMTVGVYYVSAVIAGRMQDYDFLLPPSFVFHKAGLLFVSAIPMLAFFWLLSVCITSPAFSVGIGLFSIVPSVLIINTKLWFAYPMAYPFFVMTGEYGKLTSNITTAQVKLFPWVPAAAVITAACILISCLFFGQSERK